MPGVCGQLLLETNAYLAAFHTIIQLCKVKDQGTGLLENGQIHFYKKPKGES